MAEEDIYGNKALYESFISNLEKLKDKPKSNEYKRKYYVKSPDNLKYFKQLHKILEKNDTSYIRRNSLMRHLLVTCFITEKDIVKINEKDIDDLQLFIVKTFRKPKYPLQDIRCLSKLLFPVKDEKGRIDDEKIPYPYNRLRYKEDKSRQKSRKDKLTWEEYENIVKFFSRDPMMQSLITLQTESLARPQELCYLRLGNIELNDNYAKIHLTDHGKEGIGILQCIDSFPYLLKWLDKHPFKENSNSYIFLNQDKKQQTPFNINKKLKIACKHLGIDKPITMYSIKRCGVTFARLQGATDVQIQHRARWASTKQLQVYDLSTQQDAFDLRLIQKGIKKDSNKTINGSVNSDIKICIFCGETKNGFADTVCKNCKHILDRNKIQAEIKKENTLNELLKLHLEYSLLAEDKKPKSFAEFLVKGGKEKLIEEL